MSEAGKRISPKINEQCFLIEKAEEIRKNAGLLQKYKNLWTDILASRFSPIRQLGERHLNEFRTNLSYINTITKAQNSRNFFEISPAEKAQLAHYATIHIVKKPEKGSKKTKSPIFTESAFRDGINTNLFRSIGQRTGAGIVSLDISHEGIDSATEKIGLVNAKFIFQDIRTMLSQPYVELFKVGPTEKNNKDGKIFRTIEFELGWSAPADLANKLNLEAIKLKVKTHLVKYTFDLNPDGSVTVDAQYMGQITDIFSGPNSNILALSKAKFQEVKNNQEEIRKRAEEERNTAIKKAEEAFDEKIISELINDTLKKQASGGFETLPKTPTEQGLLTIDKLTGKRQEYALFTNPHAKYSVGDAITPEAMALGTAFNAANKNRTWTDVIESNALTHGASEGNLGAARERIENAFSLIGKTAESSLDKKQLGDDYERLRAALNEKIGAMQDLYMKKLGIRGEGFQEVATGREIGQLSSQDVKDFLSAFTVDETGKVKFSDKVNQLQHELNKAKTQADKIIKQAEKQHEAAYETAIQEQLAQAMLAKFLGLQQIGRILQNSGHVTFGYIPRAASEQYRIAVGEKSQIGITNAIESVTMSDFLKERELDPESLSKEEYQVVPFLFLGQFLEAILALPTDQDDNGNYTGRVYDLMQKSSGESPTVDLGYINYKTPFTGKQINNFPLYYLPISLKKINDFFAREVVAKELQFFSFKDFLTRLIRMFFTNMFNVCANDANNVINFVAPKVQRIVGQDDDNIHYFIYGAKSIKEDIEKGKIRFGNYQSNYANKIYHFFFGGQSSGAVINVKVLDVADEIGKTAIYFSSRASAGEEKAGAMGEKGGTLMPVVFQADIQTIGFPLFNLGQLVYVDLSHYIQNKNNRLFKATGYYGVHKISHSFSAESFTSNVTAMIQMNKGDWKSRISGPSGDFIAYDENGNPYDTRTGQSVDPSIAIKNTSADAAKKQNPVTAIANRADKVVEDMKKGKVKSDAPSELTNVQEAQAQQSRFWKEQAEKIEARPNVELEEAKIIFLEEVGPQAYEEVYGGDVEEAQGKLLERWKKKSTTDTAAQELMKAWIQTYYPEFVSD